MSNQSNQTSWDTLTFRYQQIKLLGKGGQALVYVVQRTPIQGSDRKPDKQQYALKVFHPGRDGQQAFMTELVSTKKIRATIQTSEPNLVNMIDCSEQDSILVYDLCNDGDLREFRIKFQMTEEIIIDVLYQCAKGLAVLHKFGYMHRDIKLENTFINYENGIRTFRIGDFGLCVQQVQSLDNCGTQTYQAPELASNRVYDKSVDIWALGIMMDELVHESSFYINEFPPKSIYRFKKQEGFPFLRKIIPELLAIDPGQRKPAEWILLQINLHLGRLIKFNNQLYEAVEGNTPKIEGCRLKEFQVGKYDTMIAKRYDDPRQFFELQLAQNILNFLSIKDLDREDFVAFYQKLSETQNIKPQDVNGAPDSMTTMRRKQILSSFLTGFQSLFQGIEMDFNFKSGDIYLLSGNKTCLRNLNIIVQKKQFDFPKSLQNLKSLYNDFFVKDADKKITDVLNEKTRGNKIEFQALLAKMIEIFNEVEKGEILPLWSREENPFKKLKEQLETKCGSVAYKDQILEIQKQIHSLAEENENKKKEKEQKEQMARINRIQNLLADQTIQLKWNEYKKKALKDWILLSN